MSADRPAGRRVRAGDLQACPELWQALGKGKRLRAILEDFYSRVFDDEKLAPFFANVTQEHVIGKQYAFMADIITGSRNYFGERPRNAHHWMVISDALFDYREELLEECMRAHDLPAWACARWRKIDEVFRKQIVKSEPVPRKIAGIALPLDGYERLRMSIGTVCDGCAGAIDAGEEVHAHVRTGQTFCLRCMPTDRMGT